MKHIPLVAALLLALSTAAAFAQQSTTSQGYGVAGANGNELVQIAAPPPSHLRVDSTPSVIMPGLTGGTNPCTQSAAGGGGVTGISLSFGTTWSDGDCQDRNWFAMSLEGAKYASVMGDRDRATMFMSAATRIACTNDRMKGRLPPEMCNPQTPTPQVPVAQATPTQQQVAFAQPVLAAPMPAQAAPAPATYPVCSRPGQDHCVEAVRAEVRHKHTKG